MFGKPVVLLFQWQKNEIRKQKLRSGAFKNKPDGGHRAPVQKNEVPAAAFLCRGDRPVPFWPFAKNTLLPEFWYSNPKSLRNQAPEGY
jgi:hypothetical protein